MIREIVSRKDPFGYYVVIALNTEETRALIEAYARSRDALVEEFGDVLIIKGKSRGVIEKIARSLAIKGLLASNDRGSR